MITPDTAATAMGLLEARAFWKWLNDPRWHHVYFAGLMLGLADWARRHPDRPIDGIAYSLDWLVDMETLGLTEQRPPRGYTGTNPETDSGTQITDAMKASFGPQVGRYAVFVRPLREESGEFDYFRQFEPLEILGYTVYIYEISEADVKAYWRSK